MDVYAQIAEKIIEQQETVVGPVAIQQAQQVAALKIDWPKHQVSITGDESAAIDQLVEQYKILFGNLAIEVCREAASKVDVPHDKLPKSLR
jgi:hypothetical protein